ncbi:DUF7475 family protein [Halorarius halobius]|uniref:DUF7475 family protein n=1 Tax=Halorarius halobius TaxID=2962671 RepID=UPI003D9C8F2F
MLPNYTTRAQGREGENSAIQARTSRFHRLPASDALITILAFFGCQEFSPDAFFQQGSLNQMAVVAKAVELVLAVCAGYLYSQNP